MLYSKSKSMFVVPAFEIDSDIGFPKYKSEVVKYYNTKQVRQIHITRHAASHRAVNYEKW